MMNKNIIVFKYVNDICLNEKEYLLDDDFNIMKFPSPDKAIGYLQQHGSDTDTEEGLMDCGIYLEERYENI